MQKHFVRTIFWDCTQNLHLATGLLAIIHVHIHANYQYYSSCSFWFCVIVYTVYGETQQINYAGKC